MAEEHERTGAGEATSRTPGFYGWLLVVVGFFVYGFGMAPAYYSWGFFAPEVIADLGLSRQQIGEVFGAFTLIYSLASPLAAWAIRRFGLRVSVTAGALLAAVGFFQVSRAQSFLDFLLGYSLIGGIGIGFSTILAGQTLAVHWFRRYRARAIAIVMLGAAVVGAAVTPIDDLILRRWDWRMGWVLISGTSLLVAAVAAIFVRNRPEDLGQLRDGRRHGERQAETRVPETEAPETLVANAGASAAAGAATGPDGRSDTGSAARRSLDRGAVAPIPTRMAVVQALWTPQFFLATFASLANAVSWRVLTAHGRLHLENLGFTTTVAAAILGVRVGVSAVGRLSGSLGDFVAPARVLALALVVNASGIAGLVAADTPALAYLCVVLIGVGYGAGYISAPVVFADFFGREAFVGTSSLRITLIGIVGFVGPSWAGAAADSTGSYTGTLVILSATCITAAVAMLLCRRPAT